MKLFEPIEIGGVRFKNRLYLSSGTIVSASPKSRAGRLGQTLVGLGYLSPPELEEAERVLPLVRRFVTANKRPPQVLDLHRFLAEIGHPQAALLQ